MISSVFQRTVAVGWRAFLRIALFAVPMVALCAPAEAKVTITNCLDQKVRICAKDDNSDYATWVADKETKPGENDEYSCDNLCYLWINASCSGDSCKACTDGSVKVDHGVHGGYYRLVSLDTSDKNNYKSSDLEKVDNGTTTCQ